MGGCAGKTLAPAEPRHELREYSLETFTPTPELLGWREKLCQTHLEGYVRELVASSELLEIDEKHVLLRPRSQALLNEGLVLEVTKAFTEALGAPFAVTFTSDECADEVQSISRLENLERLQAQRALVDAFRSDPFVQKVLETLNATLDESSVRVVETTEKEKSS